MISKLFTISSMYQGYLESFYNRFKGVKSLSYDEHYKLLLDDTTEFIGSYTKAFIKLGVDAKCAIANNYILQSKWRSENCGRAEKEKNILFEQVKKFQPEILWIDNLSFTDNDWLEYVRANIKSVKLIIAYHCSPFSTKIIERLKYVDFLITCTPGLKEEIENKNIRTYLVYHGFDSDLIDRIDKNNNLPQHDLVFSGSLSAGTGFHGDRIELVESIIKENIDIVLLVNLENRFKIKAKQVIFKVNELLVKTKLVNLSRSIPFLQYGTKTVKSYSRDLLKRSLPPVYGTDMYNLLNDSKIVLNMHGAGGNYAGNMRLFEVTGVGSCLLTDNKRNLGDLFAVNKEVIAYDNSKDCIEKIKWLLGNDDERRKIAEAGRQKTLKFHTVENRCRLILEIIGSELNTRT